MGLLYLGTTYLLILVLQVGKDCNYGTYSRRRMATSVTGSSDPSRALSVGVGGGEERRRRSSRNVFLAMKRLAQGKSFARVGRVQYLPTIMTKYGRAQPHKQPHRDIASREDTDSELAARGKRHSGFLESSSRPRWQAIIKWRTKARDGSQRGRDRRAYGEARVRSLQQPERWLQDLSRLLPKRVSNMATRQWPNELCIMGAELRRRRASQAEIRHPGQISNLPRSRLSINEWSFSPRNT